MNQDVTIRRAAACEAGVCARLLYISGPELYSYCFVQPRQRLLGFFELMLRMPGTMYSLEHTMVEVKRGIVTGLLLSYPASEMQKLARGMLKRTTALMKYVGLRDFTTMLFRLKLNKYMPELEDDEFFVSNLAVKEEYRGQGSATRLMKKAEEIALDAGLQRVSLYVETDNRPAKRLYDKLGFSETEKRILPERYSKHGLVGFCKMTKSLPRQES
jgi:ribosomal protein S18 acetylase RimI-like enzyme